MKCSFNVIFFTWTGNPSISGGRLIVFHFYVGLIEVEPALFDGSGCCEVEVVTVEAYDGVDVLANRGFTENSQKPLNNQVVDTF